MSTNGDEMFKSVVKLKVKTERKFNCFLFFNLITFIYHTKGKYVRIFHDADNY